MTHASLPMPAASPGTSPAGPPSTFKSLAGANLAAQAAEQVSLAAVPMVAVLMLGAGTRETGLLAAAQSLPFLLLALPFGLWADRASRRSLMIGAEAARVVAMGLLALLVGSAAGRWLTLPALAALGFVSATGTVAFSVAVPAIVAQLVPREQLAQANGRLELARSLAFAAGPALAGALVAAAGGGIAFALAALLSATAVALLVRLPRSSGPATRATTGPPGRPASASVKSDLAAGARFVWHHRWLRPVLLTAAVWNLSWMVLQAAYVPHAVRSLGLGPAGVGLTLSLYGVGMVLGAVSAPRLMRRLPLGGAIALGPVVSVAAALTVAATLHWPTPWLAGLSMFLFGAGPVVWVVSSTTLRQALTPAAMLGRVSSIFLTVNAGARPVGAALGAGVAAAVGPAGATAACLLLATAGFFAQAALILASQVRGLRNLPEAAPHDAA